MFELNMNFSNKNKFLNNFKLSKYLIHNDYFYDSILWSNFNIFSEYNNYLCYNINDSIFLHSNDECYSYKSLEYINNSIILNKNIFCFSTNDIYVRDYIKDLTIRKLKLPNGSENTISLNYLNNRVLISTEKNNKINFYDMNNKNSFINQIYNPLLFNVNKVLLRENYLYITSKSKALVIYDIRYLKNSFYTYENGQGINLELNKNKFNLFLQNKKNNENNILNVNINNNFTDIINLHDDKFNINDFKKYKNGIIISGEKYQNNNLIYLDKNYKIENINFENMNEFNIIKNLYITNNNSIYMLTEDELGIYN